MSAAPGRSQASSHRSPQGEGTPVSAEPAAQPFPPPGDIVIFQPEFEEFGGEERVILSLSAGLHAQGKAHSVLCYHDRIGLARHAHLPLPVFELKPSGGGWAKAMALRAALARLHARGDPTPVLFSIQSALHAGMANLRGQLPYFLRIPDTYSLLNYETAKGGPGSSERLSARHWLTRHGIRSARGFATNTLALANEMHALYGRRAEVVYLGGFGQQPLAQLPARASQPIELLSVSRLQKSKRVDWILQSLAEIVRRPEGGPDFVLHVVGAGPEEAALKLMSQELELGERVRFHGFVSDDALTHLYQRSHVFLMPACQGYGLPAIEALYRRQGVVLNHESGVVELLADSQWAVVAEPGPLGFTQGVRDMFKRVCDPRFFAHPLPSLPTEGDWAKKIIASFGW
ncbi:glycosyltransferase [Hydrogenophaga sp.]|uniref:glycosyltransferase n=1 Tax=Hydrogenophaga sp. TaxID=1904254 RepID=UPI002FC7F845